MGFKANKAAKAGGAPAAAPANTAEGAPVSKKRNKRKPKAEPKEVFKKPHVRATEALAAQTSTVMKKAIGDRNPKEAALQTLTDATGSAAELRDSLGSLYALAADSCKHSAVCRPQKVGTVIPRFPISQMVTAPEAATTEQLWGQLNVVFTPVLRTLKGALEADSADVNAAVASGKKKAAMAETEGEDEEDYDDEAEGEYGDEDQAEEDDQEEEEAVTFGENDGPRKDKKSKRDVPEKDKWKYAFGVGNDYDDDEEEEEDDFGETRADRRRNSMRDGFDADDVDDGFDAEDDNQDGNYGGGEGEDGFDPFDAELGDGQGGEDDEAALKELYGSDAEYDANEDMPFGGDDEGEDDMDDLELLDEENPEKAAKEEKRFLQQRYGGGGDDDGEYGDAYGDEEDEGEVLDGDSYDFDDDGKALDALSRRKKVRFDENGDPEDPTAGGELHGLEDDEEGGAGLSSYEKNELKRKRSIQDLEENRLFNKDWTMMGEAAGKDRGRDVLLDEKLEFDHAMRQVPVITDQVTSRLESRIKKRILDNHFDDVERRQLKTTAGDLTTSKRDEGIDAQKSKHSLMDLYEKDYLEKQKRAEEAANGAATATNAEPLTEIEKDELKAIAQWKRLSQHLDALSNFFYTPKPVQEEVSARVRAVEGHAPAIALESVGVLGVQSKEAAVAPQDLFRAHKDKFVGVSKAEMDPAEKQALRRAKKTAGKAKQERLEQSKAAAVRKKEKAKAAATAEE